MAQVPFCWNFAEPETRNEECTWNYTSQKIKIVEFHADHFLLQLHKDLYQTLVANNLDKFSSAERDVKRKINMLLCWRYSFYNTWKSS